MVWEAVFSLYQCSFFPFLADSRETVVKQASKNSRETVVKQASKNFSIFPFFPSSIMILVSTNFPACYIFLFVRNKLTTNKYETTASENQK